MRHHFVYCACAVLLLVLVPLISRAATIEELTAQIQALLQQVTALQSAVAGGTGSAGTQAGGVCISGTLSRGMENASVTNLQAYLAKDPSVYPEAIVSGYYGVLTERAVQRYQSAQGIVSSGSPEATGWGLVGPRTREHINARCTPNVSASYGGGTRQDAISVRLSGSGALSVVADVVINGSGSCSASTYAIDWGDGSAQSLVSVPAGLCAPRETSVTHTYQRAGDLLVVLHTPTKDLKTAISVSENTCTPPTFQDLALSQLVVGSSTWLPLLFEPAGETFSVVGVGLPPGVELRPLLSSGTGGATRRSWDLVGTPTYAGTYAMTVTAQNACGKTTRTWNLTVLTPDEHRRIVCPNVVPAVCVGTLQVTGRDVNGCVTGYRCIADACPVYTTPTCLSGDHIVYGAPDWRGCQGAPRCVSRTATLFTRVYASTTAPVSRGSALPIAWATQNASSTDTVRLEIYRSGATTTLHNNDSGIASALSSSGSFNWSVPSAGAQCTSGSGLLSCINPGTYRIVAKLYSGDTCWGSCTVTSRNIKAIGESAIFTIQ